MGTMSTPLIPDLFDLSSVVTVVWQETSKFCTRLPEESDGT